MTEKTEPAQLCEAHLWLRDELWVCVPCRNRRRAYEVVDALLSNKVTGQCDFCERWCADLWPIRRKVRTILDRLAAIKQVTL